MPQAAMAAGSIAGSAAGGLLKKAISGDKKEPETPQVDPTAALQYYTIGMNNQVNSLNTGLNYYTQQIAQAKNEVTDYIGRANLTLQPLSTAAFDAMNRYMQMLGMDPITQTSLQAEKARQAGYTDLAAQIDAADQISDPEQRAQYKQSVLQQIDATIKGSSSSLDGLRAEADKLTSLLARANASGNPDINNPAYMAIEREAGQIGFSASNTASSLMNASKRLEEINKYIQDTTTGEQSQLAARQQALGGIRNEFESTYGDERPRGFTGEEVEAQIASTPGYAFQLEQGTKAITRQQAASGMLNSGQTGIALAEYGQNLAQNAYAGYMNNLANIVNQGSAATMQIAANQAGLGQALAGLSQSQGQAGMNTYGAIGQAQANWGYASGQTRYAADEFNTGLKFKAQQAALDRELQREMQGKANQIQSGYLDLARNRQSYDMYQNQQIGAGFMAGQQSNSGQYYKDPYGNIFRNWGTL